MINNRFFYFAFGWLLWVSAKADAPNWLNAAASLPTPAMASNAPAVILLDDTAIEVDSKGTATEVHRMAVRILHDAGRKRASGNVNYISSGDKVLSLEAWLIRKQETIETKKKRDWIDIAANAEGAVIDEQRSEVINLSEVALTDDVFGYETKVQYPLLEAQLAFGIGSDLPVLTENIRLILPDKFSVETKHFGPVMPASAPSQNHTWQWTWTDRPYRPEEPYELPSARVDAELIVRLIVPAGLPGFTARSFGNWAEVVGFYEMMGSGQCDTSAGLSGKVQELIKGRADSLAKIQALGGHVQKLRYIAINTGIRRGNGLKPRKASLVFATGYGDCKDKANLLVAMLREAGLKAYPVSAYLGKDRVIKPDCPTPAQFNHAIVAIEVDEKIQLPAVVTIEKLGRLLIFDPTDSYTQLGDVSATLQGSLVHVEAPGNGILTALPVFSAQEDFKIDRQMAMTLSPEGTVTVAGRISAKGQAGATFRALFERSSMPKDLERLVTMQLNDKFRGATIKEKKAEDDLATGRCILSFNCEQPNFLQRLQGQTAIVKLDVLSRHYLPNFSEKERLLPIQLPPVAIEDEITLTLPPGYVVDELPAKTALASSYGSCNVTYAVSGSVLTLNRTVVLNQSTVPVEDYAKLRQFLSEIAKADRTALLMKRHG